MSYNRENYWRTRLDRIRQDGTVAQGARKARWEAIELVRGSYRVGAILRLYAPQRAILWRCPTDMLYADPLSPDFHYTAVDSEPGTPYRDFAGLIGFMLRDGQRPPQVWRTGDSSRGAALARELQKFRMNLLALQRRRARATHQRPLPGILNPNSQSMGNSNA